MNKDAIQFLFLIAMQLVSVAATAQQVEYVPYTEEPLREGTAGLLSFKLLVDSANLGDENTRIAELTFSPEYEGELHTHNAIEIFYVVSGRFGHNINGTLNILEPGEIGIYRPGDTVIHSVESNEPAVVLTIWVPGGVAAPFHFP